VILYCAFGKEERTGDFSVTGALRNKSQYLEFAFGERIGRLVLTNCDNYDQFPPDALRKASAVCRTAPWLARAGVRRQAASPALTGEAVVHLFKRPWRDGPVRSPAFLQLTERSNHLSCT